MQSGSESRASVDFCQILHCERVFLGNSSHCNHHNVIPGVKLVAEVMGRNHDFQHIRFTSPQWHNQRAMRGPYSCPGFLRYAPLGVWVLFSIPLVFGLLADRHSSLPSNLWAFLGAFGSLGAAFAIGGKVEATGSPPRQFAWLGVQSGAILVMSYVVPDHLIGFLFVLVAWQLALFLTLPTVVVGVAFQSAILLAIYAHAYSFRVALAPTGINIGFQTFAVVAALFAKSQLRAKQELAHLNAELRATRELVVESGRMSERIRISRDLHDVMGHNLTALSIHLEVASHLVVGQAQDHLLKAKSLSKTLLGDIREIVSATRSSEAIDIGRAVQALCEGIPNLQLHAKLPRDLVIEDPNKAQVFLRCVQEVVTNTLRHSEAKNLWIQVTAVEGGLLIDARDDGRGNAEPKPGLGLSNMRDRLEEIGGRLTIESRPMQGFVIRAWLPSVAK